MINLSVPIQKTVEAKGHKLAKNSMKSSRLTKIQSQIFTRCTEERNPKNSLKRFGLEFPENLKKQVNKLRCGYPQYTSSYCLELDKGKCLQLYSWISSWMTYSEAL